MKVGDKLICRKNFNEFLLPTHPGTRTLNTKNPCVCKFEFGKEYIIYDYTINKYVNEVDIIDGNSNIITFNKDNTFLNTWDYFYTIQEAREFKLKQLGL